MNNKEIRMAITASVDNTLLHLQNSYPTQPHSIISKYLMNNLNFPKQTVSLAGVFIKGEEQGKLTGRG